MNRDRANDLIHHFIAEGNYTDEAIEDWSRRFPALAGRIRETAMACRLTRIEQEVGKDALDDYLGPDLEGDRYCWDP